MPDFSTVMEAAKDAVFDAASLILGFTESEANDVLRYQWPTGVGSNVFSASPSKNVCYIGVSLGQRNATGVINRNVVEIDGESAVRSDMHVNMRFKFIFYGPMATVYSQKIYSCIKEERARNVLKNANMDVLAVGPYPSYVPELIDGNWYERSDVEIEFYALVEYFNEVGTIAQVPNITIREV